MFVETPQHEHQVFEWDNTVKTQDTKYYNDCSEVINDLPILNISDALKKFNTYNVTQAPKVESRSEKIARIRGEIAELAKSSDGDEEVDNLSKELEAALAVKKTKIAQANNQSAGGSSSSKTTNDLNLESRVFKLEQSLGQDSLNSTDLFSQVENLNKKLCLLEPSNLQSLDSKLISVSNRLSTFSKYTPTEADLKKQNELEKNVKKLTQDLPVIPQILNRLVSLQNIHEQVCRYMNQENRKENVIEELNNQISEQKKAVEILNENIKRSSGDIKNNLAVLEERVKKFSVE